MPRTLLSLVDTGLQSNETGIALAVKRDGKWIETSISEFNERVERLAAGLYALGIRANDKVGLHAENCTEWIICDHAILSLGAATVPIYATQPGDQIQYILSDAGVKIHITSSQKLFNNFAPYVAQLPNVQHIGFWGTYQEDMKTMDEVCALGRETLAAQPNLVKESRAKIQPDDLATLIYTSGTTGLPKGVMLTHWNIASNVEAILESGFFVDPKLHRQGKLLSYLPLSHIFERAMSFLAFSLGLPLYFIPNIDNFLQDIQEVKPIHFTTVPRLLEKVYSGIQSKIENTAGIKRKLARWAFDKANNYTTGESRDDFGWKLADKLVLSKFRELFGGNLVGITSGGAALPAKIMNFINGIGINCAQGYGLTETSPVLTIYDPKQLIAGSSGKALIGVELKLVPTEGGMEGEGEIVARGPNIMKGYYNRPEDTAEVLTTDGWFYTGDIGRMNEEGFLFITDRKKELMKLSTGKYVAPSPLEDAIILSAYIDQACVVGSSQKFCAALIVPNVPNCVHALKEHHVHITEENFFQNPESKHFLMGIIQEINKTFPAWEQVKNIALLEAPFSIEGGELTPKLSMKRRVIQEKYSAEIEGLYT